MVHRKVIKCDKKVEKGKCFRYNKAMENFFSYICIAAN